MSDTASRRRDPAGAKARPPRSGALRGWVIAAVVAVGAWAVFFGLPAAFRHLNAPPISEEFGLEDAVAALRLIADDTSYLVLVNEDGETRSAQLEERGFEDSMIAWSAAGLSTGGPADEYLLREDGLSRLPLPATEDPLSEDARIAIADGFAVYSGTVHGNQLAFVDATKDALTVIDAGFATPSLTACDDELVLVDESGVRAVTEDTEDLDGLNVFDDVATLTCDGGRVYGLGEIIEEEDSAHQALRVWDRATGEAFAVDIRYPQSVLSWRAGSPFVWEGRLYWGAEYRLWSIPLAEAVAEGSVEASIVADLGGFIDDFSPVVGSADVVTDAAGGRVFGVAEDGEFVDPLRGRSYDRLDELAIFSVDTATGERRIEIEIDGIDFPTRDVSVHAIAVDPEWAAGR